MDASNTRVIAVVGQHWLLGGLRLGGTRIQDFLQDDRTGFVHLFDTRVCQYSSGKWPLATAPKLLVPKDKIEFLIKREPRHEAPTKRLNNLVEKSTVNVLVVLGRHSIHGTLHLQAPTNDILHMLRTDLGPFFPITDVSLNGHDSRRSSATVVFVNQDFLSAIYLGDSAQIERCHPPEPAAAAQVAGMNFLGELASV